MDSTFSSAISRETTRRSNSCGPTLSRRGLVTTSAGFFTGGPPSQSLKELACDIGPDFVALEARQRSIATRRVELLKRQASLSKEMNALLSGPDGMLKHTNSRVNNTRGAIWHAQKRGAYEYYSPPPRVTQLDKGNALGGKTKELADLEKEIQAGHEEERLVLLAMKNLNVGAVEGRGPRAGQVTNLSTWRSTYGNPSGHLSVTSPGYATEWKPHPRYYGGPNSPLPHGHKRLNLFTGFASSAVDMKLGRDLK